MTRTERRKARRRMQRRIRLVVEERRLALAVSTASSAIPEAVASSEPAA